MKINIITEAPPGWVLRRISENLNRHLPDSYITNWNPDGKSDINIYENYALFRKKTDKIDIGWFTHRETDGRFEDIAKRVDHCMAVSKKTALLLPSDKTTVIEPCIDSQFYKEKIVFGCVGKHQAYGRKRFHLISELDKLNDRIEIRFTEGKVPFKKLPEFYQEIDYLLVLSTNEGGPLPVAEAIAMGKPVIAPDVGWCWDFPVIRYNTVEELKDIINRLVIPEDCWKITAEKVYALCKRLYELRCE